MASPVCSNGFPLRDYLVLDKAINPIRLHVATYRAKYETSLSTYNLSVCRPRESKKSLPVMQELVVFDEHAGRKEHYLITLLVTLQL